MQDGITTLSYPAEAFAKAPQLTIDSVPVAVLGGPNVDPKFDLTNADIVVPLQDDRYATFGRVGSQLKIFDAQGKGSRSWGGQGQGPGDFVRVNAMVLLPGDSLFLIDDANRRRNWVLPDKGVVRQEPYVPTLRLFGLTPTGFLANGQIVAFDGASNGQEIEKLARPPVPIVIMGHAGESAKVVDSIPGWEIVPVETHFRGRAATFPMPLRLGRIPRITAWDSVIASTSNDSYTIDLRGADGRLKGRITVPIAKRAVTAAMRDTLISSALRKFSASGEGEGMVDPSESKRLLTAQPIADSLPFISKILVSSDKTLWAVDYAAPGENGWNATAFRSDGAIIGRLRVSRRDEPMAFANDRVIVRHEDDDGVISFRVHRIIPGH